MKYRDEQDLITRAKKFDMQALALIYDRYSPGLYRYAMRLLGDDCMAEDCVSETYSRFLRALRAGQGPGDYLQAYLYRVAHNCIVDIYRRQPPPPEELPEHLSADDETQPESEAEKISEQNRVRLALRMLTPDQRQVILLRFYEEWGNEEVSAAVQKPVGAVKALQHRALEALRRWLCKDEGKEDEYGYKVRY